MWKKSPDMLLLLAKKVSLLHPCSMMRPFKIVFHLLLYLKSLVVTLFLTTGVTKASACVSPINGGDAEGGPWKNKHDAHTPPPMGLYGASELPSFFRN